MQAEYDGHLAIETMDDPRFFFYGNARIVMESNNPWYARFKHIGVQEVSRAVYDAADVYQEEGEE